MINPEELKIQINDQDSVTALLYLSAKKEHAGTTVILGHGAGANQQSSFMREYASGLATRGFDAMTFNFIYMEQGRSVPDQKLKLESCYGRVIEEALRHKKLRRNRLVIGGKSMGGRIASQVAASAAENSKIAGLVFLGYPLHPPGNPSKLRIDHLPKISSPMLFVQGTRDALGSASEIRLTIDQLKLPALLYVVEGGDHSFKVPKSLGIAQEAVHIAAMDEIARWLRSL